MSAKHIKGIEMPHKYHFVELPLADGDSKVLLTGGTIRLDPKTTASWAQPDKETAKDMDITDVFHTLASMQHKLLTMIDVPRLDDSNINELASLFEDTAETMALFNMILVKLGKGSEELNDAINAAQKAFEESIEERLGDSGHATSEVKEEA